MRKEKFCIRFKNAINKLKAKFNKFLEQHIDTALHITNALKTALNSPVIDVLTHITPTDKDDKAIEQIRKALAVAVAKLSIVKECNENENLEDKIKCWIEHIKQQPLDVQKALLVKFGAIVAAELDGNKEAQHVYDAALQSVFSVNKVNV